MTIVFYFDEYENCGKTLFTEKIDAEEYRNYTKMLKRDSRMEPNHLTLSDIRQLDELPSAAEVREFAAAMRKSHADCPVKRAAIIAEPGVKFGLARMFALWVGEDDEQAFTDLPLAIKWLGLSEEQSDPFSWDRWQPDCVCRGRSCIFAAHGEQQSP